MEANHTVVSSIIVCCPIGPFEIWIKNDTLCMIQVLTFLNVRVTGMAAKFNLSLMINIKNVRNFISLFLSILLTYFLLLVCYLGYGSPSKLLSSAIKKVISVPTELECKKECIRFRENSSFKCFSFSFR